DTYLPEILLTKFNQLRQEQKELLTQVLVNRNGLIVEYNGTISAMLGCNTNVSILGSEEQAKSTLLYLLKYVTKPPTEITHSISLIHHARRTIENYPSVAEDSGTDKRTAMHLLNRVTNQISSTIEVSSSFASLAILGGPAEFTSCSFFKVYVHEAFKFAEEHPDYAASIISIDNAQEFENLPGDEFEEEEPSDDEELASSDKTINSANGEMNDLDVLFAEESEPQVFTPSEENSDHNEDHSTAVIYTGITGKIAVPQHIHYSHRGPELHDYNLYEFASIVDVVPKKKSVAVPIITLSPEDSVEDNQFYQELNDQSRSVGRPSNGYFNFATTLPLYATHQIRLRSKMKVPIPKYIPKPPPIKPAKLTEAWKKQARYDNGNGTLPGSLTWYEFCKFIKELENGIDGNGSSIIDVVRLHWILNMSHGFRTSSTERAAVQKFVRRSATIWGVPDSSTPIGRFEPSEEPILEDETLSSETAQLAIDLLRSEAAADDQMSHLNYKENQYLQATEAALEKIHG
ncbi:Uncharacterized protein APZ42_027731, partial [Daphnia magna]